MSLNTPQGTQAMTLDQAVTHMQGKLAERGATVDDTAISHPADPNEEAELESLPEGTEGQEQTAEDEVNAEAVSEGESQEDTQEPDARPILLPDGSEITVEEARKGYLRQADFTRKTQALATEREALAAREQAAVQQLGGLYQQLASLQESEPDWLRLSQERSPEEYQRIQAYWKHKSATMSQARQVIEQQQANARQVRVTKALETLNSGEYEPTWKDQGALKKGLEMVTNYLADNYPGIPQELITSVELPEVIVIADKARRFDELQKAKPKAVKAVQGKPAPFKPGAKSTASPQSEQIRILDEKFRQNPSVDNATALQLAKVAALKRR